MIYGIIDMGSNSIRLCIYECKDDKITQLVNRKTMMGLAGYVENNNLTYEGISNACNVLNSYKLIIQNFGIKNVSIFATASLRNIDNTNEAVELIKNKTGYDVYVISGEEEGICDFIGVMHDVKMKEGILLDIGGGSTEIVIFKNREIQKVFSLKIGSLKFYSKYVGRLFPEEEESRQMKEKVLSELRSIEGIDKIAAEIMCGVGGSIKGTKKLSNEIFHKQEPIDYIETNNIAKLINYFRNIEKDTLNKILKICPDRIHTIIPGMIILHAICEYFNCKVVNVSENGVREGFLVRHILGIKINAN